MRIFFGGSIHFTLGRKKRKCTFKIKCMAGRCDFVGWSTKNIPGSLRVAETLGFVKGFLNFSSNIIERSLYITIFPGVLYLVLDNHL